MSWTTGIITIYDPATGLATLPVGAAAWNDDQARFDWARTAEAEQLRADVAGVDDSRGWVAAHLDPAGLRVVTPAARDLDADRAVIELRRLVDEIIVERA